VLPRKRQVDELSRRQIPAAPNSPQQVLVPIGQLRRVAARLVVALSFFVVVLCLSPSLTEPPPPLNSPSEDVFASPCNSSKQPNPRPPPPRFSEISQGNRTTTLSIRIRWRGWLVRATAAPLPRALRAGGAGARIARCFRRALPVNMPKQVQDSRPKPIGRMLQKVGSALGTQSSVAPDMGRSHDASSSTSAVSRWRSGRPLPGAACGLLRRSALLTVAEEREGSGPAVASTPAPRADGRDAGATEGLHAARLQRSESAR